MKHGLTLNKLTIIALHIAKPKKYIEIYIKGICLSQYDCVVHH